MLNRFRPLLAALGALALTAAACADQPEGVAVTGEPVPQEESTTSSAAEDGPSDDGGDSTTSDQPSAGGDDGGDEADGAGDSTGEDGIATIEGERFVVQLSGAEAVPGPGDEGASGGGEVVLADDQVCVDITVSGLSAPVAAAHIHAGAAGQAGDVVVPLPEAEAETETDTSLSGCVDADAETIDAIVEAPQDFYVNVHTADFPDGAARGQLTPAA